MQEIKPASFSRVLNKPSDGFIIRPKEYLKNKLLHPQNRLIHQPLKLWIPTIRQAIQEIKQNKTKHLSAKEIADLYREATTVFMALENYKDGREICYSQIQFFIRLSEMHKDAKLLKYALYAWVNLSRLDRFQGDIESALDKINRLNTNNRSLNPLYKMLPFDTEINHIVNMLHISETIKIYLEAKRYNDLIAFIESKNFYSSTIHRSLFYEALAIAFANADRVDEALDLFSFIKTDTNTTLIHIFNLRENEIRVLLHDSSVKIDLQLSQKLALCSLRGEFITPDDIIFGLHTAYVLQKCQLNDDAKKLTYFCLIASQKINDDLLKATSLTTLYGLVIDKEEKNQVENMMINLYLNTSYVAARERMLAVFQDLKQVDSFCLEQEASVLFEELLSIK